jgi:hypothetical protein
MSNNTREQFAAELLGAALEQYRNVEPRTGLEERILANLQSEQQSVRWFWWQWRPVLVSAAVIVILFAGLSLTKRAVRPASENVRLAVVATPNEQTPSPQEAPPPDQINPSKAEVAVAAIGRITRKWRVTEASAPRLIAQQTRPLASSDLRIEEVKIPAVSLAEINIR